jgi:hypothetical protein
MQLRGQDRLVTGTVLEIEHDPVEAGDPHDLGRQRRRQVDEGPDHRLARLQTPAKARRNRTAHRRAPLEIGIRKQ